jgi:hypothetical protein
MLRLSDLDYLKERPCEGIHYSASDRQGHDLLARVSFQGMWPVVEPSTSGTGNRAKDVADFILLLDGCNGLQFNPLQRVHWDKWERIKGDCPTTESEVTQLIDAWRARASWETRLMESRFYYNRQRRISPLMEIMTPDGPVLRTIVRVECVISSLVFLAVQAGSLRKSDLLAALPHPLQRCLEKRLVDKISVSTFGADDSPYLGIRSVCNLCNTILTLQLLEESRLDGRFWALRCGNTITGNAEVKPTALALVEPLISQPCHNGTYNSNGTSRGAFELPFPYDSA